MGGFLGLLLGGTVITLFELLDFIIYNCIVKYQERSKVITYPHRNDPDLEKRNKLTTQLASLDTSGYSGTPYSSDF